MAHHEFKIYHELKLQNLKFFVAILKILTYNYHSNLVKRVPIFVGLRCSKKI